MKKTKKIVLILIITFLLVSVFNYNNVYAAIRVPQTGPQMSTEDEGIYQAPEDDPIKSPDYYDPSDSESSKKSTKTFMKKAGVILGAIQGFGSVLSVIALVVIGIKYMLGSAEEKANYKQTMIPYVIGIILLFASTTIVNAIFKVMH